MSLPITTVGRPPLSSIRTVPTACPTRKAMSAVRFSPTTPRMPSVPNSLPIDITSFVSYDVTVPMGRGFSHADGWADAPPHFSFVVPKEKRAVHGPKRKALARSGAVALRATGGGGSVQAPIWPGLRARYTLLRFLQLPSRGGSCGGRRGGHRMELLLFSLPLAVPRGSCR